MKQVMQTVLVVSVSGFVGRICGRIFGFPWFSLRFRPDQFRDRSGHPRGVLARRHDSSGTALWIDFINCWSNVWADILVHFCFVLRFLQFVGRPFGFVYVRHLFEWVQCVLGWSAACLELSRGPNLLNFV